MPIVRKRSPFGMGQTSGVAYALGLTAPEYDTNGRYLGGNAAMDFYCNGILGQTFSPQTCAIPSLAQIQSTQTAELATTSAPPNVQQEAITAGNLAVTAACSDDPSGCAAQAAASLYPQLSAAIGPALVASLFGINPDGSQNIFGGWGIWALAGVGLLVFSKGAH
jgi:hypothetical protein